MKPARSYTFKTAFTNDTTGEVNDYRNENSIRNFKDKTEAT
jgi:hypothetical protein